MRMSVDHKLVIISTVELCGELEGLDRTEFIESIHDHYEHSIFMKYPLRERKRYYELLSELVKNFGH